MGRLIGFLEAGEPRGLVFISWHAKETLRGSYAQPAKEAEAFLDEIFADASDRSMAPGRSSARPDLEEVAELDPCLARGEGVQRTDRIDQQPDPGVEVGVSGGGRRPSYGR